MDNVYDKIIVAVGYKRLVGKEVSRNEVGEILNKYPASQWLDIFAKFEAILQIEKADVLDPHKYLNEMFFSESILKRLISRETDTAVLFTLGQLNVLRKLTIIYCQLNCTELEVPMKTDDIATVLLAGQDIHNSYDESIGIKKSFENYCEFIVRNGYLCINTNATNLYTRTHQMFVEEEKNTTYTKDKSFHDFFKETMGIDVEEAMSLSFALANPFFLMGDQLLGNTAQTTILDPKTFFQNLIIEKSAVENVIESLTINFSEARGEIEKEIGKENLKDIPVGYNLDLFRKKPLIRLEDGKLVCANVVCLLEKTTQNLIWQPKSRLQVADDKTMKALVHNLTSFRGKVFENYLKFLCAGMDKISPKLKFKYIPPEVTEDHEEVGDSILVQGKKLMIIEAKSRQFKEGFKHTGKWAEDKQFIDELLKKASEQIEIASKKILSGETQLSAEHNKIRLIYPVIVTYEHTPMHAKMQRYVRQRVKDFGFLKDDVFAPLEIIHISDVERSMDCANTYTLIDLVEKKHSMDIHAEETDFHNFFSDFINSHQVKSNGWRKKQFKKLCEDVFKKKLRFK